MAWTSMHFAVGMACSGALAAGTCMLLRKGWRWIPAITTVGGLWATIPDCPRLWREDFPSLPFASTLGQKSLEHFLHEWGDLFFFHHFFDTHRAGHQYALHGLILMILFYNAGIAMLLWQQRKQRATAKGLQTPRKLRLSTNASAAGPTEPEDAHEAIVRRLRSSHLSRTG